MKRRRVQDMLNNDCWELVFNKLRGNRRDIDSLSLVCRTFLSITNGTKKSLLIKESSPGKFARLLRRFPHLKCLEITIQHSQDSFDFIRHISRYGLELESLTISLKGPFISGPPGVRTSMKSLKKLTVMLNPTCPDADAGALLSLVDFVPCLEELSIRGVALSTITDDDIELLSSKHNDLVKISLRGLHAITDQSLISLSSNCLKLTDVSLGCCRNLTEKGIGFMMKHISKLTSLYIDSYFFTTPSNGEHTIENSISYARNLEYIQLCFLCVSDDILRYIANSCPLLKKIIFARVYKAEHSFTIYGLREFYKACSLLEHFEPRVHWLTDESMVELSQHLHALTHINLDSCSKLSSAAFYMLTKRCSLLQTIHMDKTSVGTCNDPVVPTHQNYQVNYLSICSSQLMNDKALKIFGSVCPNLESLLAKDCHLLTDEGISGVVRICPKMRFLEVSNLNISNFLGLKDEDSELKLTTIFASNTNIGDECMKSIGMRCPDLEELNIKDCKRVTIQGAADVVKNCKKLKKINMGNCMCVSVEVLEWMVMSRPSLERIVVSSCYYYTTIIAYKQPNLFFRKGSTILEFV